MIKKTLYLIPAILFAAGMGTSYGETFDDLSFFVLEYEDGISATVQLEWTADDSVATYEVGCVSCMPNTVQSSVSSSITIQNVTPFPNSSNAMLYVLAYDSEGEVLQAKQVIVNLEQQL
ncbi:MAG: hypothetical protein ACR2LL_01580 [Nitrosopumilus sp.]|uniref:hypothetical protein n=1 Tax=Nitrosopumilus sp. TaxID=2024843 RepID=UPI00292E881E|nr:hypothetical protein [Nitrosopumilus sp.]